MIRTRSQIERTLGVPVDPAYPYAAVLRVAILHAGSNIGALAGDVVNPFDGCTEAQLESLCNALLDCEERVRADSVQADVGQGGGK